MGFFARKQGKQANQGAAQPATNQATSTGTTSSTMKQVQHGNLTLITHSPEETLQQLEEEKSRVSFGMSKTEKYTHLFSQIWVWFGPVLFAMATTGEIYQVLIERQTVVNLFISCTIIAFSVIAEGTLIVVSFASKNLRHSADKRASGWTEREKGLLGLYKGYWFLLAAGVGATTIFFIVSQTKVDGIGVAGVWTIAIVRACVALVADHYTAFACQPAPTSGDIALATKEEETRYTEKSLAQEKVKITAINSGSINVQQTAIEAGIKQDELNERRELMKKERAAQAELEAIKSNTLIQVERLKAESEIAALVNQMKQTEFFIGLQNQQTRLMYDPSISEEERKRGLISMLRSRGVEVMEIAEAAQYIEAEKQKLLANGTQVTPVTGEL